MESNMWAEKFRPNVCDDRKMIHRIRNDQQKWIWCTKIKMQKKKTHWRKVDVFPRLAHKKQKYCFGFKIELCDQKLFVCVCVYVGASSNECRLRRLVVQYFHIYKKQNFVSAQTDGVEEAHEVKQKKIRRSLRRWKKNGCCSVFSTFVTSRCFGKMQTEFFLLGGLLRKFGLCSHCEEKSILVEIEGR